MFFVTSMILRPKNEPTSRADSRSVLLTLKIIKLRTLFQKDTNNSKGITISPVRALSGQITIFFLGGIGNSNHVSSNNDHAETTVKVRFLTVYKERSWFEPAITQQRCHTRAEPFQNCVFLYSLITFGNRWWVETIIT